jgi:hypothetical protein
MRTAALSADTLVRVERRASATSQRLLQRASPYDRDRHLPRVLPVSPADLADDSPAARRRIVARLARALRAERIRGRAGHWTYDLDRHIALAQAYAAERRHLSRDAAAKPEPS